MSFCSQFSRPTRLVASPRRLAQPTLPVCLSLSQKPTVRVPVLSGRSPLTLRDPKVRKLRSKVVAKAEESSAPDVDAIVKDLAEKWDKVENKSSIALYGVGAIAVLYVTASIIGAVNSIPLLPKFLELVGFVYTAWFVYRYLLFKSSREELAKDVEELKAKIAGQSDRT